MKLLETTCCHRFGATGTTAYLGDGGTLEGVRAIAAYSRPAMAGIAAHHEVYDRTGDEITLDEIGRIAI
ncbi:MAG: hypothetical protein HY718_13115 [Planctomycetes bacterium]|nr:hypothetical protein [Planctomycetota bacterium]